MAFAVTQTDTQKKNNPAAGHFAKTPKGNTAEALRSLNLLACSVSQNIWPQPTL